MLIRENNLIKLLKKDIDQIKIKIMPDEKSIYIMITGLMLFSSWIDIPNTLRLLKDADYIDSNYKALKNEITIAPKKIIPELASGSVEKTNFIVESVLKTKAPALFRIFKLNGVPRLYQQAYVDVFNSESIKYQATASSTIVAITDVFNEIVAIMQCVSDSNSDAQNFIETFAKINQQE